ncbi:hypothetical protein [Endozoicomonas sp. ALB115]|uniref:hypothetical protein n=1 Tax=Endozoicomonas sp. ALB115 TaxID=3403074 RepID=UPI003BB80BFD
MPYSDYSPEVQQIVDDIIETSEEVPLFSIIDSILEHFSSRDEAKEAIKINAQQLGFSDKPVKADRASEQFKRISRWISINKPDKLRVRDIEHLFEHCKDPSNSAKCWIYKNRKIFGL